VQELWVYFHLLAKKKVILDNVVSCPVSEAAPPVVAPLRRVASLRRSNPAKQGLVPLLVGFAAQQCPLLATFGLPVRRSQTEQGEQLTRSAAEGLQPSQRPLLVGFASSFGAQQGNRAGQVASKGCTKCTSPKEEARTATTTLI
jgi:hypothetical protein